MLVALTSADGTDCYVNPANVVSLTRVPVELSPTQATTYVNDCDQSARLVVVGTPADIAAALDAGAVGGAVGCVSRGFVDGATGAVTMVSGVPVTGVRTGVGRYTMTFVDAVIDEPTLAVTPTSYAVPSQNGPIGATFSVAVDDGQPAHAPFM